MKGIIAAAVLAAIAWALKRWLDQRDGQAVGVAMKQTESWENEGGALAPPAADSAVGADAAPRASGKPMRPR